MDVAYRLFFIGLFGIILGMIGALAMVEMINRSNNYLEERPPNNEKNNQKGDTKND